MDTPEIPLPTSKKARLDALRHTVDMFAKAYGLDRAPKGQRWDSMDTIAFARQLDEVRSETYDVMYPELKRNLLLPNKPIPNDADTVSYKQFDQLGEAKLIHDYGTDFPDVEVSGKEFIQGVASYGDSYKFSIHDLRKAKRAGFELESKKALAARLAIERKLEKLCVIGDAAVKVNGVQLYGLANNPNVTVLTGAGQSLGGTGLVGNWDDPATAVSDILADVNKLQKGIVDATIEEIEPDTLVLPVPVFTALATRQRSATFTDDTVLQYILKSSPWLKRIVSWAYLQKAGASSSARAVMYKLDPMIVEQRVAVEFEQFAPQPEGMTLKTPCHGRHGGVAIFYPKGLIYADGLQKVTQSPLPKGP